MALGEKYQYRQTARAFTIVELLIVIVVIAILATLTIVAYNGIQQRAQASAASTALSQASKKLKAYEVDNGLYPTQLSDAGITNSSTTYQYTVNNSTNPKTFCITATNGTTSYYITSTSIPTSGGCAGHGQGGVAAVTNYYVDPKPNVTSLASWWPGSTGNTGTIANTNVSWSGSQKANRMTFTAVSNTNGGSVIYLESSYSSYIGQKFTVAARFRVTAGTAGIGNSSVDRNSSSTGTLTLHGTGGSIANMSNGQTYIAYVTFTADSAAAIGNGLRFYTNIINKSAGTVVEYADIDMYPGDYDASRLWHSGDSPNWTWNGTPNNSTSTGPPL